MDVWLGETFGLPAVVVDDRPSLPPILIHWRIAGKYRAYRKF